MLTCSICVKKVVTPTNTKNKQIPSISLLWAAGSGIENVCVEEDTSDIIQNPTLMSEEKIQISSLTGASDLVNPYRQDLAEKQRVHWIDSSIHSGSKSSKNHVRPFWGVVLQNSSHRSWFYFLFLIFRNDTLYTPQTHSHTGKETSVLSDCTIETLLKYILSILMGIPFSYGPTVGADLPK